MEYINTLEDDVVQLKNDFIKYLTNEIQKDEDGNLGIELSTRMKLIMEKITYNESTPTILRNIGEISKFMGNIFMQIAEKTGKSNE